MGLRVSPVLVKELPRPWANSTPFFDSSFRPRPSLSPRYRVGSQLTDGASSDCALSAKDAHVSLAPTEGL